jgi:hypothetical protein
MGSEGVARRGLKVALASAYQRNFDENKELEIESGMSQRPN